MSPLSSPAPILPPCQIKESNKTVIKTYPLGYLNCIFNRNNIGSVCGDCGADPYWIKSIHYSDLDEDDYCNEAGFLTVDDSFWSCPHKTVFFAEVPRPIERYSDGSEYKSWFDILVSSFEAQGRDLFEEDRKKALAQEKKEKDPRYKTSMAMKKYFNAQIDKKRSAGKNWKKETEKPCKYALRTYVGEDVTVYKFSNPVTGKKDKLLYAECWQWECTDPLSGKIYDLHICNCVHPGEKDAKGKLLWKDDWLTSPDSAYVYDRLEDWFKWEYSHTEGRWIFDAEKPNNPLTNRKKGVPLKTVPSAAKSQDVRSNDKTAAKPATLWSRISSNSDNDGWHNVSKK